jgi:hypothetical protein
VTDEVLKPYAIALPLWGGDFKVTLFECKESVHVTTDIRRQKFTLKPVIPAEAGIPRAFTFAPIYDSQHHSQRRLPDGFEDCCLGVFSTDISGVCRFLAQAPRGVKAFIPFSGFKF